MHTKRCPVCKETKDRAAFNKSARYKDGLQPKCRSCDKEYYAANRERHKATIYAWRAAHPIEHRERTARQYAQNPRKDYHAAYRDTNRLLCRARAADWAARNAERRREKNAMWQATNIERRRVLGKLWQVANRDKECAKAARRRAAKMRACPTWADLKEVGFIYAEAQRLSRETGIPHHVDHIVPLQSRMVCGLHVPCNLRAIPAALNMSKSNRHWPGMTPLAEAA